MGKRLHKWRSAFVVHATYSAANKGDGAPPWRSYFGWQCAKFGFSKTENVSVHGHAPVLKVILPTEDSLDEEAYFG
jgi:hypothetical protein